MEKYGDKFFKRILTDNEIAYCKKFSDAELHFAGRFAPRKPTVKLSGPEYQKILDGKILKY
jgi:phosphopantetheinyl transferase (holo-ACP synthase)